jgi:hypothetical protein
MNPEEVITHVDTFKSLAEQFDRLKARSLDLQARIGARERGYFTPEEEEETARLYIAYIHSRNALLETVLELRDSGVTTESSQAFILCLGGALMLVDAAQFLRDTFGNNKIIRAKLNEANPVFGIPVGTYDHIQRSLTDPTNNWHLQQGRKHYEQARTKLSEEAPECRPIIERIDEISGRLRATLSKYLKERLGVRRDQLTKKIGYNLFGRFIYDIQRSFASMMAELSTKPGHQPGLPKDIDQQVRQILRPGDVLLSRKEHVLTNYFLPGYWPHGALNLGSMEEIGELGLGKGKYYQQQHENFQSLSLNDPSRALEALKDGVHLRTLASPLGADSIVIIRPNFSQDHLADALDRVLQHTGKPYDFDFDFTRADRMVCTEVIYRAYDGIADLRFHLTKRAGRMTLSAMDLIHMALKKNHFELVASYIPNTSGKLLQQNEATDAVHALS